ncbi:MAG: hypothetical protein KUG51_04125 [Urechidicola sp.]|nr:hypothetical protein [Urechidicola sp.]
MKGFIYFLVIPMIFISCNRSKINSQESLSQNNLSTQIVGTWKLVYGEIREKDSITIRDISKSDFIKIINKTHFAFINQDFENPERFYGGAGSYTLNSNDYIENLDYIKNESIRGHSFTFTIEIKGDTLIQQGLEEVKKENLKRYILEKYIRIENI